MKNLLILLGMVYVMSLLLGCATPRTKWTDPAMRVAVVTDNANSYVEVQTALMDTGKFFVVDRSSGFQSALSEQDFNQTERVEVKERFARLGRMFGVGGVIVAHVSCVPHNTFFAGLSAPSVDCTEHLSLISTTTGEVVASSRDEVNTPSDLIWNKAPSPLWSEAVNLLADHMPAYFEKAQWEGKEMAEIRGVAE